VLEILRTTQLPLPLTQTAKKAKGTSDPLWAVYAKPCHNAWFWDVQTRDFNSAVEDKRDEGRYNLERVDGRWSSSSEYPRCSRPPQKSSIASETVAPRTDPAALFTICFTSRKWQLTRTEAASDALVVTNRGSGSPFGIGNRCCRGRPTWLSNELYAQAFGRHQNILSLAKLDLPAFLPASSIEDLVLYRRFLGRFEC
jgi:hypothetical protein